VLASCVLSHCFCFVEADCFSGISGTQGSDATAYGYPRRWSFCGPCLRNIFTPNSHCAGPYVVRSHAGNCGPRPLTSDCLINLFVLGGDQLRFARLLIGSNRGISKTRQVASGAEATRESACVEEVAANSRGSA